MFCCHIPARGFQTRPPLGLFKKKMSRTSISARDRQEVNDVGDHECEHELLRNIRAKPS